MDPYQRITARMAIEHDWFDSLRAKDPDYAGDDSSVDASLNNQASAGLINGDKRILSPEHLQKTRGGKAQAADVKQNLVNKASFSQHS